MIKNHELFYKHLIISIIGIISSTIVFFINHVLSIFVLSTYIVIIAISYYFDKIRYNSISELSLYLNKICNGDIFLDVRDNREGELSILKNEIYKVTTRLIEYSEALKQDKTYLANALSDISHQLKTPLTSMYVMTDLLREDSLPPDKRYEFTANIEKQLKRLEWLVSSLLTMSKLDAGTLLLKKEELVLQDVIEASLSHLRIPMDIKNQTLIINCDNSIRITGDSKWLAEAFSNIIKNCIEHTHEYGQISITCAYNRLYTHILIEDNGEGIDPTDIPHIFKRFYRGKNSSSDSVGIGLAMAHEIIKRQNGIIEVNSVLGRSTCFSIKFYTSII